MYEQRYNPYAANVKIVKGYLKSGKVLFIGILHFLSLGFTVVSTLMNPANSIIPYLMSTLNSMGLDTTQLDSYSYNLLSSNLYSVLSTVISSLFTLLTAIAFIIMFAKSRSSNPDSNPSSGAAIMRVLSLITFIFTIIGVIAIVALYVLFIIGISSVNENFGGDTRSAVTVQVILGIAVSLVIIFLISITASQKNFYRSIRGSLNSVELQTTGAVGFGVWNIVFAVVIGMSLVGSIILSVTSLTIGNLMLVISSLITFLTLIMTASFALGYNSYIKDQKYGYNDPYNGGSNAPYYPSDNGAPNYGAPSNDYNNYPNYNMPPQQNTPPQQNMPPYNETPDNYYDNQQNQAIYCPNCGASVERGQSFCSNCGHSI